ncbi:arylsulfatase A-like enzyme [Sinomonas atrocyanea]|uniref:sulfatase family protein n=1 Tax=Sinomonas atrocyanea TaxID=37927 RepID=UPI0027872805|nr:sulfatase-like hydrolase/transferase [Sinomonas atrocyanea]MDQ0258251.1 arylsulfatase A-like enzyme [Sinomonas atrocyanea]
MTRRPNVLVIVADQLRADHLGFGGNTVVKTQNLDALADRGMVFENATVANPTCMPNRASLVTGRWPSAHGTRCNGIPLDPASRTLMRSLADTGYRTLAVGKLHHQNMGWEFEPEQQAEIRATAPLLLNTTAEDARPRSGPAGWDHWEDRARHEQAFVPLPTDYYGYSHVDLIVGHGDHPGGHYLHWARERGLDPDAVGGPDGSEAVYPGWDQVYRTAIPADLHPSAYIGEKAVEHLKDAAGHDAPFFLFVSFPDPHHPFSPPAGYDTLYDPDSIPLPLGFDQDHSRSPRHIRHMVSRRGEPGTDPTMTWAATAEQYRHAAAAQYGLITLMDEQIGRILAELDAQGLSEDTIVVFTADHGDLFGDHGLMLKHFCHYRAVTNVPLVVALPGASAGPRSAAGRSRSLVASPDLVPTLMELTGAGQFRGIQGISFASILHGGEDVHRPALLIEEDQPFGLPGLPGPVRMRTVVTAEGRLTRYFGAGEVELYDHALDPWELHNVAGQPEYAALERRLTEALVTQMASLADEGTAPTAAA